MTDAPAQTWWTAAEIAEARLPDMPVSRIHELLPWHWKTQSLAKAA